MPDGASRRRTRRHSGERRARRARTSSSRLEPSDRPGSSRRAARTSSAISGSPPERSATSSSAAAVGRSPSISATSWARSNRSSGPSSSCAGGSAEPAIEASCGWNGWPRVTWSRPYVRTRQRRAGRATRARNVARLRVPASARWRSSRTSSTGRCSPARSSRPWMASAIQAARRSGAIEFAAGVPDLAGKPGGDRGKEPRDRLGPDAGRSLELALGHRVEPGAEALDDGAVGGAIAGWHGCAADDLERRLDPADASRDLRDQSTRPHAAPPRQENPWRAPLRRGLEGDRKVRELPLPSDEALADVPRGHGPIVPHGP